MNDGRWTAKRGAGELSTVPEKTNWAHKETTVRIWRGHVQPLDPEENWTPEATRLEDNYVPSPEEGRGRHTVEPPQPKDQSQWATDSGSGGSSPYEQDRARIPQILRKSLAPAVRAENPASQEYENRNSNTIFSATVWSSGYSALTLFWKDTIDWDVNRTFYFSIHFLDVASFG